MASSFVEKWDNPCESWGGSVHCFDITFREHKRHKILDGGFKLYPAKFRLLKIKALVLFLVNNVFFCLRVTFYSLWWQVFTVFTSGRPRMHPCSLGLPDSLPIWWNDCKSGQAPPWWSWGQRRDVERQWNARTGQGCTWGWRVRVGCTERTEGVRRSRKK